MDNDCQGSNTMKKTLYLTGFISLFMVGISLACNLFTTPIKIFQTKTPTATFTPTVTVTLIPIDTSTPTPTEINTATPFPTATGISVLVPIRATPTFAPLCDPETVNQSQCQYPIAKQRSAFCEYKSPYNLIILNDRATYELLHKHVQCSEAGVINGQRMITCTGPMAYYYELRVCDLACSGLRIETNSLRCSPGYSYNNLQNCCTKETQEVEQGCVVLKLDTKSCAVDCGQFTNRSTCANNGYSCRWDNTQGICQLKK